MAAAGRKAIKVIACWSHKMAVTPSGSFSNQLRAPLDTAQKSARTVLWNLRESGVAVGRPPNYWTPMSMIPPDNQQSLGWWILVGMKEVQKCW